MILYTENEKDVDIDSLELMYIYIDSYKVFQKIGFCLHPAYETTETIKDNQLVVTFSEKNDFVDLFEEEKVNVKIICGKNGCGKSTLLFLIKNYNENCVYVFKDDKGRFAASKPIDVLYGNRCCKLYSRMSREFKLFYACTSHEKMQISEFRLEKNIVRFYADEKDTFDNILPELCPLFTHFCVKMNDERFAMIENTFREFVSEEDAENVRKCAEKDWVFLCYVLCLCESSYYDKLRRWKNCKTPVVTLIQNKLKSKKNKHQYIELCNDFENLINTAFDLKEKDFFDKKLKILSEKTVIFLESILYGYICTSSFLFENIELNGYVEINKTRRYIDNLSTGEYLKLKYSYELYHSVAQSTRIFLDYDEIDKSLHPEWCRHFVKDFFEMYQRVQEYDASKLENYNRMKRMSFFFATHSPFLLSDVTNDYVIYLEKDENGISKEVKMERNSFAGNIGEMFSTNFFMNDTIGAFATSLIKDAIGFMNEKKTEKKEWCKKICSSVGDDILKALLLEKWNRQYEEN